MTGNCLFWRASCTKEYRKANVSQAKPADNAW